MPPNYIPLFPNLPNSPCQLQHNNSNNIQSDFPPCRVHESTPEPFTPPTNLSQCHQKRCPLPSESPCRSQPPKTSLRAKNISNTIHVTVKQATDASKSSLKRRLEPVGIDHPSKMRHIYDEDMEHKDVLKSSLKRRLEPVGVDHSSKMRRIYDEDIEQAKGVSKSSLKRKSEPVGIDHPLKTRHVYDEDMEWLEWEIDGIKERIMQMNNKLDTILHKVQQFNEI